MKNFKITSSGKEYVVSAKDSAEAVQKLRAKLTDVNSESIPYKVEKEAGSVGGRWVGVSVYIDYNKENIPFISRITANTTSSRIDNIKDIEEYAKQIDSVLKFMKDNAKHVRK